MKINCKNNRGMSLVEVIISIALIGIIAISILSMFVFSSKSNKKNEIKMNAMNIAYSQMEWIKGLKYEDIGYKPNGIIEKNKYMNEKEIITINGIEYTIKTIISWEKANSLLQGELGKAIKKVEVTVYLKNKKIECATLDTLITYEHEGEPQEPGNLYVYVFMKSNDTPVPYIEIKLENFNEKEITDGEGLATFGDLSDGEYTIIPEANKNIMFEPTEVVDNNYFTSRTVNINKNSKEEKFYGEYPVFLEVDVNNLCDMDDLCICLQPDEHSVAPPENSDLNEYMKIRRTLDNINDTKLWWKWIYKYEVFQQNTENKYFLIDKNSDELWNDTFEEPDDGNNKKEVYLGAGLNSESNVQMFEESGKIKIKLKFSAPLSGFENMKLKLNDNSIDDYDYVVDDISKDIIIEIDDKDNKFEINDNSVIEITNPEVLMDKHGIKLAQKLNKSFLKIGNGE
ncbi:prepilin-type N-terminal cleavage/methylation domain-containing protein [Sporanaerobacter acetigenes]|uniref:prepilin-type N-terminal cleavage/methylation domain-containing protein n=1 Tax=Sporanaerobacter acetigenes TaxID=165813 RepID=UPI0033329A58